MSTMEQEWVSKRMANDFIEEQIRRRATSEDGAYALSAMWISEAVEQGDELLTDYFDDVQCGRDLGTYTAEERQMRLDRLADVITRLRKG